MASTIKLKTGTGSAVPSALAQGEVGINIDNGLIYYGSGSGNSVKQLESFTNITASGDISASGTITAISMSGDGSSLTNVSATLPAGVISGSAQIASDISGSFTAASASFSTRVTANDAKVSYTDAAVKTKLNAENVISGSAANVRSFLNVENGADVTDASNVTSAGALMDSELSEIATIKTLTKAKISGSWQGQGFISASQVQENVGGGIVSSSAQIADVTLTTAAQTNITSLGTLTTLTVDDITINGSTISDGADLTIDAEGDITLDANGADVILKDDGTEFGRFKRDSSDFVIKSATNNKDIVFRGVDGSSTITALTLDMSDAGHALFTGDISGSTIRTSGDIIAGGKITGSHFLINPASAAANEVLFEIVVGSTQKAFIDEDGDASFDGLITCNALQVTSDGNQSAPAIKFGTDINTGIFQPADNQIALQANGSTTELTVSTDGVEITNGDFIINETIVHSGDTDTKVDFTTNNIQIDAGGTTGLELDITGSILHNVKQNVFNTASVALGANGAIGDIVKFGNTATAAGGIYYLKTDGTWGNAQANAVGTATASLAVAVGTNSTTDGMCLRGFVNPYGLGDARGVGSPVYLHNEFGGRFRGEAPTGSGHVVRALGHQYGTDLVYFNPSNDFIIHA